MFADNGRGRVWDMDLWPLWFFFIWVCVAPFASLYRVGPLSSFYLEAGSLLGAAGLVFFTATEGRLKTRFPATGVYFLVLAAFWWLQARLMNLTYPGLNDMVVWTFVILALAAWACRSWIAQVGQERVVSVFAWVLVIGALIQAFVVLLQFTGWATVWPFNHTVAYSGLRQISGQLGQRNHLGHYLMWGVLAASYLWAVRRVPNWAGVLLVLTLTVSLGLVSSRTILGYIVGIGLMLPVWRLMAGRSSNRMVLTVLFMLAAAAAVQFGIGHILDWFAGVQYDTAVERAGSSSFEGSARNIEWVRAWKIFQTAPLWGHGWNSFALQSFLLNAQEPMLNNNILNVLFTHSHNIILNLLAEMGLAGTLLVVAGYLAAIWRLFARPRSEASLLMLAMMAVSLCHSMLEYPFWYIYFLTPFALMMSLSPARETDLSDGLLRQNWRHYAGAVLSLVIAAGIVRLGWAYTELTAFNRRPKTDTAADILLKNEGLKRIARDEPMLRYYAQLAGISHYSTTDDKIDPWAEQAALEALVFRPYANAHQVGIYRFRRGQTEEGIRWMHAMYRYYPHQLSFYVQKAKERPELQPLLPDAYVQCALLHKQYGELFKKINKNVTCPQS